MNRRWILAALLCLAAAGTEARAEDGDARDIARAQEIHARDRIQGVRAVSRHLKRQSSDVKKAARGSAALVEYAAWLRRAAKRVGSLTARWSTKLDYFQRDFPSEALARDPERRSYAADWISENNGSFEKQARYLRNDLTREVDAFAATVPEERLAATRSILADLAP